MISYFKSIVKNNMKTNIQLNSGEFNKVWNFWYALIYGYFYRRLENKEIIRMLTKKTLKSLFNKTDELEPIEFIWQQSKQNLCSYIKEYAENLNITSLDLSSTNFKDFEHYHFDSFVKEYSNNYKQAIAEVKLSIQANLDEESILLAKQILIEGKSLEEVSENLKIDKVEQKIQQIVKSLLKSDPQILFPQVSNVPITTVHPDGYSNSKNTLIEPWKYIFEQDKSYLDFRQRAAEEATKELGINSKITILKVISGLLIILLIGGLSFGAAFVFANSNKTSKTINNKSSSIANSSLISSSIDTSSEISSSEDSSSSVQSSAKSVSTTKSSTKSSIKSSSFSISTKSSIKSSAKSSSLVSSLVTSSSANLSTSSSASPISAISSVSSVNSSSTSSSLVNSSLSSSQ
jgi:hypothetical protein